MKYTEESFNMITAGDRLMQSALGASDVVQRMILFVEARRCYKNAGLEATVRMIDRWIGGDQIQRGTV